MEKEMICQKYCYKWGSYAPSLARNGVYMDVLAIAHAAKRLSDS